jgi:hypothetical protein
MSENLENYQIDQIIRSKYRIRVKKQLIIDKLCETIPELKELIERYNIPTRRLIFHDHYFPHIDIIVQEPPEQDTPF